MGSFVCSLAAGVVSSQAVFRDIRHPLPTQLTDCPPGTGQDLAYREEDYALAAQAMGASDRRIILVHLLPNAASHIIVVATLSIPGMILAETALSFLGLGIQPPVVSWGVLLQHAQEVAVVLDRPWLLLPGVFVVLAVLSFNFLGDGLRDAADPYSN